MTSIPWKKPTPSLQDRAGQSLAPPPDRSPAEQLRAHQLDRRADEIDARSDGHPDDLISTRELAAWLGVCVQWAEIGRHKGYGPKFIRLSPQVIKYRRSDVLRWLDERLHQSTAEYEK